MNRTDARPRGARRPAALLAPAGPAGAIQIVFDYRFDTAGFFNDPVRRATLEVAADYFETFTDTLDPIEPGEVFNAGTPLEFSNTWTAILTHPGTGAVTEVVDLVVPADTLIVFAGARDLPGSTLGSAGPGGFSSNGIGARGNQLSWGDQVRSRGELGVLDDPRTDTAPWGGALTFDTQTPWHFGVDTGPAGTQSDFLSVALHELGHIMGFGTTDSFEALADPDTQSFTGPAAAAAFGGPVPLAADLAHFAEGTRGVIDLATPEVAMDPSITRGRRKLLTDLDLAAFQDIGWEAPSAIGFNLPGDGFVGAGDLDMLLGVWNQAVAPGAHTDPTGDGFVGAGDLDVVLGNWNAAAGALPADLVAATVVPEPASLGLLALAAAALGTGRPAGPRPRPAPARGHAPRGAPRV